MIYWHYSSFHGSSCRKVVHASAVALKYGPEFSVRERYVPLGFRWTRLIGILALVPMLCAQSLMLCGILLAKLPWIGKAAINLVAPAGSGMPDFLCELSNNSLYAIVSTKESTNDGTVDRAYVSLSFQGDAGNMVTAQCVSEAALTLLWNRDTIPPKSVDGFGSPAEILGAALWQRFREAKVRPIFQKTVVRTRVAKRELQIRYHTSD